MRFAPQTALLTLSLAAFAPVAGMAGDGSSWNCRNTDFEISCADGKCTAAKAHTPMDIHVSRDEINWCAYSGCWTGPSSATVTSGPFVSFHGLALKNDPDPAYVVDVAIIIDTRSGAASVMASDLFTTPATCAAK
jgi:hypothetical protein